MTSGRERRTDPRYTARFDVRFSQARDAAAALNAYSLNFSAGGLCLKTKTAYSIGESLALSLSVDGERFELEGVVAWVRGEALGVRFTNVPPDIRARLEEVSRALSSKTAPM